MKFKFLFLATLGLTILSACSTSDDLSSDPKVEPQVDPETGCAHDSLTYAAALEPGETTYGWIEHYYCSQCGKNFADEACTQEQDNVIVWGKYLVTNAQSSFQDFYKSYNECGYSTRYTNSESNFAIPGLLSSIITSFAEASAEEAGQTITQKILSNFFDDEEEEKKIDPGMQLIADNLARIEQAILSLVKLYKEESVKETLNNREKKLFYVRNATHPYFMTVLNQLKGLKKGQGFKDLSEEKKNTIKNVVNEWYKNGIYNGTLYDECYVGLSELLHFYTGYWTSTKTIPELYKHVMYSGTPWTHEANAAIILARTSDILTLAEGYLMMCYYFAFNMTTVTAEKVNLINQEMRRYDAALKDEPVDTDIDVHTRWIWKPQVKQGEQPIAQVVDLARQKLWRDIWHIEKKDTTNTKLEQKLTELRSDKDNGKWWNTTNCEYLGQCVEACTDGYNHHGLTYKQQELIYNYYHDGSYAKNSTQNNYYNMLKRAGFRNLTPYENNGRLLVLGGATYYSDPGAEKWQGDVQEREWFKIKLVNYNKFEYKMYFRDYLNTEFNKSGNDDLIEYRKDMYFDWKDYNLHPRWLTNIGTRTLEYDMEILSRTNESFEYLEY